MVANAGEGSVYSYYVVRENNGCCEERSHLHTMLKYCPGSQEDGAGVLKLTRVRALIENRISGAAVIQEPAALQKPKAQLPLMHPHLLEDMTHGSQLLAALNSSMESPLHMRHIRSEGACQLRVNTVQLWTTQERHMEVRTDLGSQLTMQRERYEASATVQSFSECCSRQTLGEHLIWNATAEMHGAGLKVEQTSPSCCAAAAPRRYIATALRLCGDLALRLCCGTAASARSTRTDT